MNPELPKQLVQGFAGVYKGLRLYPLQHPAVERQVQGLVTALAPLFRLGPTVRMGLLEGSLFIEGYLFAEPNPAAEEIAALLATLDVEGLEFGRGVRVEELRALFQLLHEGGGKGEALAAALARQGVTHLRLLTLQAEEQPSESPPRQVYGRALKVVDRIFHDVRMGKIPSSTEAMEVVKSMVELTLSEPHALFALSMLKDYDNYTFTHSVNVAVIALAVGRACGLSEEQLRTLGLGSLLHDLGKLRIDLAIITKPGRLTEAEFEQIKTHPGTGADIVRDMEGVTPEAVEIVLGHHVRYDRSGYPDEVRGAAISPLVEMAAIADTYDAITTLRSYQRPMTPRRAVERLREVAGSLLNPRLVESFISSLGPYPVGSLVRLDSSEIGLVVWVDTQDPDSVRLRILFDADGKPLTEQRRIDLTGAESRRIVAEVDPSSRGITVTDYFD
jgi:HD-GYP domain-containing protein (c-di-GMP phosphodiesterase class II)